MMNNLSKRYLEILKKYESRNITFVAKDGSWPIVWKRAKGYHVWDVDGKRYIDMTSAFGVAVTGHANTAVVNAARNQMCCLMHAMGDVHPHPNKALLARELSRITFERWSSLNFLYKEKLISQKLTGKVIFGNSGFEAVEAAIKTAYLATRKRYILAFKGGYHGLGYGSLNVTHKEYFWKPFASQLGKFGIFVPYPSDEASLSSVMEKIERISDRKPIGAILVEPVQGRGGINVPPIGFLKELRAFCDRKNLILIVDEIYTGFGRTGKWFACEHSKIVPDIICLGKALSGGFPISVCVGESRLMDLAWPESDGESIHTSTFLGNPVGCAMALAQIREIKSNRLYQRAEVLGKKLIARLQELSQSLGPSIKTMVRGLGLMVGIELVTPQGAPATAFTSKIVTRMLKEGFILLPEGENSNVISFTPPLVISEKAIDDCVNKLKQIMFETLSLSKM